MLLTIGVGLVDLLGIGMIGAGIGSGVDGLIGVTTGYDDLIGGMIGAGIGSGVDCLIGVATGYDDLIGEGVGTGVVVILF
jgi:hypothetical protein